MLYLAQVQTTGSLIAKRSELKLLMRLESGLIWSPLPDQPVILAPEVSRLHKGILVLVEVDVNGQVGRVQEATQLLLKTLQHSSALQEKVRMQQAEIEAWKNSLIYQAQVLTQRALEFEERLAELRRTHLQNHRPEQLRQFEHEYETLQLQRREVIGARQKMQELEVEVAGFVHHLHEDLVKFQQPGS